MSITRLSAGLAAIVVGLPLAGQDGVYPETRAGTVVDDYHGTLVADPYRWLEDTNATETRAWIDAQNGVTFDYLSRLSDREALEERLTELWDYPRYGTPRKDGRLYFHSYNDGLQNQSVVYVQESLDGDARIILDPNTLSDDGTVALSGYDASPDGRYLAYAVARAGSDWREFFVRDITSGEDLPDHIEWVKFGDMSWTEDADGFFYGRYPIPEGDRLLEENRIRTIHYHRIGDPQSSDRPIFSLPDRPDLMTRASVEGDGRYLLLTMNEGTDERELVYYVDLVDPTNPRLDGPVVKLLDAYDASYELVGVDEGVFFVRTDKDAPREKLVAIDLDDPAPEHWRTIVPESDAKLEAVERVGGRFVVTFMRDASSELRIFDESGRDLGLVPLPGLGTVSGVSGEKDEADFFFTFSSFLVPGTTYRYDLDTRRMEVYRETEVDFDPEPYETRQVFYRSKDGTRVPMFVTHRKDLVLDGSNPVYLYGYGGFNLPRRPGFSVSNAAWLEMGGIYAVANLRGGGEYGREWHLAGTKERKQNVFDDFIAAAEYLISEGYTTSEKLSIGGGSNGGLLVGAVMTQRPDLFAVAHPSVGVMDMLRYHEFTIGWAWAADYGTSDDPEGFAYLSAYSPLHNLAPGVCYPATLVTTADHDDRVVPGHSFKFAATLQAAQGCENPTLIRIESDAGHGAGTPTSKRIRSAADVLAFRAWHLGMVVRVLP